MWHAGYEQVPWFSVQWLVDFDIDHGGCSGGAGWKGFKFVEQNGLMTDEEYPYMGTWAHEQNPPPATISVGGYCSMTIWAGIPFDIWRQLLYSHGSLWMNFNVAGDLGSYKSGIYNDPNCTGWGGSHATTVVGYSVEENFLLYANSWSTDW